MAERLGAGRGAGWDGGGIPWGRVVLLVALTVVGAGVLRVPGVRDGLQPGGGIHGALRGLGWWAYPAFILATGGLIAVGVPRLVFCPLAGAVFGFWGGIASSTVATMGAYCVSFLVVRGRRRPGETGPGLPPALAFLRRGPGLGGVILARMIPVPGLVGTLALSLSPVGFSTFFVGSLVGLLPEAIPLVLLGAGWRRGDPREFAGLAVIGVLIVVAGLLLTRRWVARRAAAVGGGRGS